MQNDVQLEQHEEAQPKKKARGLDLVSGGANCKQTSAMLCDLWHYSQVLKQRQAVRKEWLGRADGGVEEVQDLGSKTRVRTEARDRQDCQLHPHDANRITKKAKAKSPMLLGGSTFGKLLTWKSSLIARQTQT